MDTNNKIAKKHLFTYFFVTENEISEYSLVYFHCWLGCHVILFRIMFYIANLLIICD